jgi:hypothetical protein
VSGVVHGIYFLEKNEQVPRSERTISIGMWMAFVIFYFLNLFEKFSHFPSESYEEQNRHPDEEGSLYIAD